MVREKRSELGIICSAAFTLSLLRCASTQVVREKLSELELPHLYLPVARGSPRRQELLDRRGHFQAPYIEVGGAVPYLYCAVSC